MPTSTRPLAFLFRNIFNQNPIKPGSDMKKTPMTQDTMRLRAGAPNANISSSREVRGLRDACKRSAGAHAERQIRYAHESMLRERLGLPPAVRHPVLRKPAA